ncbi:helix-turn-helix domain-containing protein [Candidatus Curtissbacteria bacterium]|nr:helix-turn-helix domain-containing protein [Candidatus Curtissbacteria bacterium]
MQRLGELLEAKRRGKRISLKKAAKNLSLKKEVLESLEKEDWQTLPEPTFVKGFLTNYASYLGIDPDFALALYRRGYDEAKYPHKVSPLKQKRRLMFTPNKLAALSFSLSILAFLIYLSVQYFSILSTPQLDIINPQNDATTGIPIVIVQGSTEPGAVVSVNGEFAAVDESGKFEKEVKLKAGKNQIEVISSKKLSPKSKKTITLRLSQ